MFNGQIKLAQAWTVMGHRIKTCSTVSTSSPQTGQLMLGIGNLLLRISRTGRELQTILYRRILSLSFILLFHNIFQYSPCIGPSEVLLCCIFSIYADFTVNSPDGLRPQHKVSHFKEVGMWILRILIADWVSNKSKIFSLSHFLESWWMSSATSKLFGVTPTLSFGLKSGSLGTQGSSHMLILLPSPTL